MSFHHLLAFGPLPTGEVPRGRFVPLFVLFGSLDDSKDSLGTAEHISTYGSLTFKEDFPTLTGWMKDFKIDDEKLFSLENAMFNCADTQDYAPIVDQWISENQEWVDSLTAAK